jgi:uncharacterized C2H2 Zn-finger protein
MPKAKIGGKCRICGRHYSRKGDCVKHVEKEHAGKETDVIDIQKSTKNKYS